MSVKIETEDGRVLIQATDGSHVSDVFVGGRPYVRKTRIDRHVKLQLVFAAWMGVCIAIFVLMILGVHI